MTFPIVPLVLLWCVQASHLERTPTEWPAMRELLRREVGTYNITSRHTQLRNPRSSARGLGQLLKGTAKNVKIPWDTNDPVLQLQGMYRYIKRRYKTPTRALAFHRKHKWY